MDSLSYASQFRLPLLKNVYDIRIIGSQIAYIVWSQLCSQVAACKRCAVTLSNMSQLTHIVIWIARFGFFFFFLKTFLYWADRQMGMISGAAWATSSSWVPCITSVWSTNPKLTVLTWTCDGISSSSNYFIPVPSKALPRLSQTPTFICSFDIHVLMLPSQVNQQTQHPYSSCFRYFRKKTYIRKNTLEQFQLVLMVMKERYHVPCEHRAGEILV